MDDIVECGAEASGLFEVVGESVPGQVTCYCSSFLSEPAWLLQREPASLTAGVCVQAAINVFDFRDAVITCVCVCVCVCVGHTNR